MFCQISSVASWATIPMNNPLQPATQGHDQRENREIANNVEKGARPWASEEARSDCPIREAGEAIRLREGAL